LGWDRGWRGALVDGLSDMDGYFSCCQMLLCFPFIAIIIPRGDIAPLSKLVHSR